MTAALLLADRPSQSVQFRSDLRVLLIPRLIECSAYLRVSGPFDRAGAKDGRLAARRLDLLLEPLEILVRLFVEGEDVDRILDRHGAEPLQLAPDADAQVGRLRRQLVDQEDPFLVGSFALHT